MSYVDIQITGRNRKILFNKLERAQIKLIKCQIIDEKNIIIRVRAKDCKKVFAICGKMWYNKTIKSVGINSVLSLVKKRLAFFIAIGLFFLASFYVQNIVFSIEINGVSATEKQRVLAMLEDNGINIHSRFSEINFDKLEKSILSLDDNYLLVSAKKSGNILAVEVFSRNEEKNENHLFVKDIVSSVSGKIKSIKVFRGKQLKNKGDYVFVGEKIVEGVLEVDQEIVVDSYAVAEIEVMCTEVFDIVCSSKESLEEEICKAYISSQAIFASEYEVVVTKVDVEKLNAFRVEINYIVEIGG